MSSRLYITCYRHSAIDDFNRLVAAPMAPPLSEAFVDITHESVVSEPFPKWTSFVCVKAEADCCLSFAAAGQDDPIADPDYHMIDAGERLYYGASEGFRVAVIEAIKS